MIDQTTEIFCFGGETMKAKKRIGNSEPLLSAVARKLGHAAGALTKVTQEFTSSVTSLPDTAKVKLNEALDRPTKKKTSRRTSSGAGPSKHVRKTARKKASSPVAKPLVKSKSRSSKKR